MTPAEKILEIKRKVEIALDKTLQSRNLGKIAHSLALDIKKRTRLGYGVAKTNSEKFKLLPLEQKTVDRREELKEKGQLSEFASPSKSNLTEKGFLLDSLVGRSSKKGNVSISLKENRGDGKSNSKIESFQRAKRPFFNASRTEIKRFLQQIKETLMKEFGIIK